MAEFKIVVKDKVIQFEIESVSGNNSPCNFCDYYGICGNLKDPEVLENCYTSFNDFCKDRLQRDDKLAKGTLERNLPYIFSESHISDPDPVAEINKYCKNLCLYSCEDDFECPLKQFKENGNYN